MNRLASLLCICVLTAVGCGHGEQVSLADVEALKARVGQLEQQLAQQAKTPSPADGVIEEGKFRRVLIVDDDGKSRAKLSEIGLNVWSSKANASGVWIYANNDEAAIQLKAGQSIINAAAVEMIGRSEASISGHAEPRKQFDLTATSQQGAKP